MYNEDSPPPSPYPGRRAALPLKTETELRTACLAILTNQLPSHMAAHPPDVSRAAPAKAQLDYAAIKKTIDKPADGAIQRPNRRSTRTIEPESSEMADLQAAIESSKYSYKPDTAIANLFTDQSAPTDPVPIHAANTMRRRDDATTGDYVHRRTKSGQLPKTQSIKISTSTSAPHDRPKTSQRSGSHDTSGSTPQTDVTEYPWSTSTAPTSAGVTPARNSKRASAHLQLDHEASTKVDPVSTDEARSDVDKTQKQRAVSRGRHPSEQTRPDTHTTTRPQSRARSIRSIRSVRSIRSITASMTENIKEYIRPGSSKGLSRSASRSDSHAPYQSVGSTANESDRQDRGPVTRPPPRRDWRNWGRTRKDDSNGGSSGDVSRSSSVRGRSESRKPASSKADLDLNRELPPLPSLDQWKEQDREQHTPVASMRSPSSRAPSRPVQPPTNRANSSAVDEKDEIVAARLGSPMKPKPEVYMPRRPQRQSASVTGTKPATRVATRSARTTDTDLASRDDGVRIQFTMDDLMSSYNNSTAPSMHSHKTSINSEQKLDPGSRLRAPPALQSQNHSRTTSSLSTKTSRSHTPSDLSKSSLNLPTTPHSFSKHRKYDTSDIPPALNSNVANKGRKMVNNSDKGAADQRYRHMAEINSKSPPPPVPPKDDRKAWWQLRGKQKKPQTWMDQLEKLGIRDGVLLNDDVAGSPIVRY